MIVLFFLILKIYSWHLDATLLNVSLAGFQINPVYYQSQLYLTIFGGINQQTEEYSSSLYVISYDNISSVNEYKNGPSARAYSCSGIVDDTLYYYGGYDGSNYLNDLWSFNLSSSSWNKINLDIQPDGRIQCGMVNKSDSLIIFGGKKPNGNSTNLHYKIDLTNNTVSNISFNSLYTVLENKLWDGTYQNFTTQGVFANKTSFMQPKNIWLSKISQSQSQSLISIVEANQTNSVIYILNSEDLLLKQSIYLQKGIDSCEILDVGLFCSEYLGKAQEAVKFIFFRLEDWRKSRLTQEYIQYTEWPTGAYQSILFDINNSLMAVVTTGNSVKLYKLPKNQCTTNQHTVSCFYNKAYCSDNYQGAYCDRQACQGSLVFNQPYSFQNFTFECGGNGKCINGACACSESYEGVSCSNYVRSPCGGQSTINYPLSLCTCTEDIIGGNDCLTSFCYNDCSNIGVCKNGTCQCSLPFSGPDCSIIAVDIDFSSEKYLVTSTLIILASMIF